MLLDQKDLFEGKEAYNLPFQMVCKRDGKRVPFDVEKITKAILKPQKRLKN